MTASYRPRESRSLFIGPSLASADMGIVYLKPGPPLRGRITITAASPAGAFSGAIVNVLPDRSIGCDGDAIGKAGTGGLIVVVVEDCQFAWLGMKLVHGIKADLDAERDKGPESPMNTRAERNPFLWGFGACADWCSEQQ